jgi:hypothetical protein
MAYAGAAALLAAGLVAGLITRGHGGRHEARPSSPPTATAEITAPVPPTAAPGPVVRQAALPAVGAVELYARAADAVLQIDFAAGRVITTAVPALRSSGPVTFGVTAIGAYVRPLDAVPGYFVPDGGPARDLAGVLTGAAVLPGPDSESVWVEESSGDTVRGMREVYVPTSAVTSRFLPLPASIGRISAPPVADGSGYVLIRTNRGTFDLRPDGAHRLPDALRHGTVLATGGGRLLVATCPSPQLQRCPISLVRLPDGRLSRVGHAVAVAGMLPGVIAPDARTALVYQPRGDGRFAARAIDLRSGRMLGAGVPVDSDLMPGSAVYSADGRWAFLIGVSGTLVAVNARTGDARRVEAGLPYLYQLAVRG